MKGLTGDGNRAGRRFESVFKTLDLFEVCCGSNFVIEKRQRKIGSKGSLPQASSLPNPIYPNQDGPTGNTEMKEKTEYNKK